MHEIFVLIAYEDNTFQIAEGKIDEKYGRYLYYELLAT